MLGMKCSDCNFHQKCDASNLNTIGGKSLKKNKGLKLKNKIQMKSAQIGNHTQWIPKCDLLTRSEFSQKKLGSIGWTVPDHNVGTLGGDCSCQTFKVQLHSLTIDASLWDFSVQTLLQIDETGLLEPTHSSFDVKKPI